MSTSNAEMTAPTDIAIAGLSLAVGAAVDVVFFPGGLTTDAVATFSSSGMIGLLYAIRGVVGWLATRRASRTAELETATRLRRQLQVLLKDAEDQATLTLTSYDEEEKVRFHSLQSELRALLEKSRIPSIEEENRIRDLTSSLRESRPKTRSVRRVEG